MEALHNPIPMIRRFLNDLEAGNVPAKEKPSGYHLGMIRVACEEAERLQNNGWVSVEDRKPDVSGRYFVWSNGHAAIGFWTHGYGWTNDNNVTHWMPIWEPQ